MAKYCYLVFEDGVLVCTVAHRNYDNCELNQGEK